MIASDIDYRFNECRLGELCDLVTDGTHKTPKYVENGIPFISTANIVPFRAFDFSKYVRYISREEHQQLTKRAKPEKGDLLVSKIGTLGLTKFVDVDYEFSIFVGLALLKLKLSLADGRFLEQLLNTDRIQRQISAESPGSTRSTLTLTALQKLEVSLPALTFQKLIATVLSSMDRATEISECIVGKQRRIRSGLMSDLLSRGLDEHGAIRVEQASTFKDSVLGRIPNEWAIKSLGELLEDIHQGWSPACEPDAANENEWAVLKTTAVVWEGYQEQENKALPKGLTPRPELEIQDGDLLMTRAGPNSRVGVTAYVYRTRKRLMLSDKIYRLRPRGGIDGRFLCYSLAGFKSQKYLGTLKTGMAESQTNISQEIVRSLLTICPPAPEQRAIANLIDEALNMERRLTDLVEKLRLLKTGLMQDLLTGIKSVAALLETQDHRENIVA
jgi:type I restriction enzyme, S subunit